MKKKRSMFPLAMHGLVSLLLPIPCALISFMLDAFLTLLVLDSAEAAGSASLVSILPMLVSPAFSLSGIWRGIRRLRRRKRSKRAITCLVMCGIGLVEFIILMVFVLRY